LLARLRLHQSRIAESGTSRALAATTTTNVKMVVTKTRISEGDLPRPFGAFPVPNGRAGRGLGG
jgi:hypothetical protein